MIRMLHSAVAATAIAGAPLFAAADEAFVEANILAIFYHELGHAAIDVEEVPIFGQEEDAADVFSIFLIDALFEEDDARALAYDTAFGFLFEAELVEDEPVAWWDTHGADQQRFYNTVCLFYGADPDLRAEFAEDMELPEERAETCPEEFDQANASWGEVLDDLFDRGGGDSLRYVGGDATLTEQVVSPEVAALNEGLSFASPITVSVEPCGEANAFYDPGARQIIMCAEFEDHLRVLARSL